MSKKPGRRRRTASGKVMEMLSEHSVEYVDLRFTDPRGKWQHTAQHVSTMDEEAFRDGIMFDGSSIAGWKAINESDMILMPDAGDGGDGPVRGQAEPDPVLRHHRASTGSPTTATRAARRRRPRHICRRPASATPCSSVPRPSSSSSIA